MKTLFLRLNRLRWLMLALSVVLLALSAVSCRPIFAPKPDDVDYYTCTMHPSVRKQNPDDKCPICAMDLVPVKKKSITTTRNHEDDLQAKNDPAKEQPAEFTIPPRRLQQIGVTSTTVERRKLIYPIRAVGIVAVDKERDSDAASHVDGSVDNPDLSSVGVWAQFHQDEIPMLKKGLPMAITTTSQPGETFPGKISFISPFISDTLRTGRVWMDLVNPERKLLPGMYVDVDGNLEMGEATAVPVDAVLPTGKHNIVFIDKGGGRLEPRFLDLGRKYGNFYEVKSGVKEGEKVVTSGNFLIDAEAKVQGALKSW